jgi:hypothetical protein
MGGDIYDYISLSRIAPIIYLYLYNNNNNKNNKNNNNNIPYPSEFLSNSAYRIADYQLAYNNMEVIYIYDYISSLSLITPFIYL